MQILFLISLLCFLGTDNTFAQSATCKVTYACRSKVGCATAINGKNTLYFDATAGLFIHDDYPKKEKWEENGNGFNVTAGDEEGMPIYTNLVERYLYFKSDQIIKSVFPILKENIPTINWKIGAVTKQIQKFACLQAEGSFGGRDYEVWFAPAIPVGLGPHKLGGLPGLILEARSKDGFVVFDFRSYETLATKSVALQKPSKGKEMTWEELKKLTICSLLEAEAMSSEDSQTTLNAVPTNWDIEYNKYPFIADYKRERLSKK